MPKRSHWTESSVGPIGELLQSSIFWYFSPLDEDESDGDINNVHVTPWIGLCSQIYYFY